MNVPLSIRSKHIESACYSIRLELLQNRKKQLNELDNIDVFNGTMYFNYNESIEIIEKHCKCYDLDPEYIVKMLGIYLPKYNSKFNKKIA